MSDSEDLEKLLATLRDRVDHRWRTGEYPEGLEEELDQHFVRLAGVRPPAASFLLDELGSARGELRDFAFTRGNVTDDSRLPGGKTAHRVISRAVARQVEDIMGQTQRHAAAVERVIWALSDLVADMAESYDSRIMQQLHDLQARLAEEQGELHGLAQRLDDLAMRVPGAPLATWYSSEDFNNDFRGGTEGVKDRYRDLAEAFVGCEPVLDIGFGRGEFLELLRDAGVEAMGIEVDPALVDGARVHGLRAEQGYALEYLRDLEDGSLGGIVMIQVVEHLPPQSVIDVVRLAADKVRRGGRVLVETVNPTSLYTYAHAFWVDPDHIRPVHPELLGFLFEQARFASVERLDRSPVADDERLELLPEDDATSRLLNRNFSRLNTLLFGPQDYAILATR